MNIDFQEKAEKYLLGKMSSTEAAEFEILLNENQELNEEFLIITSINKHFSGDTTIEEIPDNEYTEKLRSVLKSEDALNVKNEILKAKTKFKKQENTSNSFLKLAASLAFILLFIAGLYFLLDTKQENLYARFYDSNDLPSVISRSTEESTINKAIIAFQNKKYKESLELLQTSEEANNSNEVALLLHYGIIYLENGNINGSIEKFDAVIRSKSIDNSKGLWFKALAYIKANDFVKARQILETISENPDNFNHSKAVELLLEVSK